MARYLICMTGASGAIYGLRLLRALSLPNPAKVAHELHLVVSEWGERVVLEETGSTVDQSIEELRRSVGGSIIARHDCADFAAPVSSGSFRLDGTVMLPCSMGTVGALASGTTANLVHRAGMVALKEGWPLVIVPRESPLSLVDLRNLSRLAEAGAAIMPASPGYYNRPQSIDELVDGFVARILDRLGAPNPLAKPWTGPKKH